MGHLFFAKKRTTSVSQNPRQKVRGGAFVSPHICQRKANMGHLCLANQRTTSVSQSLRQRVEDELSFVPTFAKGRQIWATFFLPKKGQQALVKTLGKK